ncbi:triose-phosphate transporter family-domain-containing protein [Leucosporidium creatinivorum]|uniref:Triose-phosphate transporter family-domain-containing protein n=1 Tax=Leucosporidium creatinivorum TaxID=106004 RepID=A0A1Y2FYX7_9BASI|nr:triose-phosphate transporter family-domain-containing protein [Leucosporidium creatinivorum]
MSSSSPTGVATASSPKDVSSASPDLSRRSGDGSKEELELGGGGIASGAVGGGAGLPPPRALPPWLIICTWTALSSGVILMNREILMGSAHFSYPITLTTLHLAYQTIATRLLHKYTNLISGVAPTEYSAIPLTDPHENGSAVGESKEEAAMRAKAESVAMSWNDWRIQIVPPAAMFSISLVLSNWAYLYLTTAFIHMLKAFSPVAILLAAFAFRTKNFSIKLCCIVLVISTGVGLASWGETKFNLTGVIIQLVAIAIEATRVTLIQLLLQSGHEMSPLKSLYFFAPICLGLNAALILPVEGFAALRAIPALGLFTILSNCTLTFMLNLSSVYLIGLSSMVLSLSKVVKDILLVGGSAILLGDQLTGVQVVGYALATVGLFWYKFSPS